MGDRDVRRGLVIATLMTLVIAMLSVMAPALADPGKGKGKGQAKHQEKEETTDEDESGVEEQGAEEEDDSNDGRARKGSGKQGNEDPEPSQTDPSNKGPSGCSDYNDSDGGPYDHDNCDGTQGQHGGDGNGKCAGCTGKADDKWPGGQGRNDHNNGYECDHNGGVGRGNPAHSRCPQEEAVPPPPNPPRPPGPPNPPPPNPPCPDMDLDTPGRQCNPPDDVLPKVIRGNISPVVRPNLVTNPETAPQRVLPFTGADGIGLFVVIGLALLVGGATILRLRRENA